MEEDVRKALGDIIQSLKRQEKSLATIESRVALAHEDARRLAEMVVRVKLGGDNLKRLAIRHGEALLALEARLKPEASGGGGEAIGPLETPKKSS